VVLGGDNAATHHALRALAGDDLANWALITFDAHLDVRDGVSNGSPVRQLVEAGLPGENLTQIGLADFSNSGPYAARVAGYGSTVVPRTALRGRSMSDVVAEACDRVSPDGRPIYVDLDMDVADRSVVPGCPAAAPGGLSADELRDIARACGRDPRVAAIDFTEIDPARDDADERTVRLAALCLLEFAAGVAERTN
jgi:formiminoglutamase